MGVRGLTSFIARDAEKYLRPIHLKDCHLVIDGNCIASHLYKWCTKRDSAFGGDYDEYYIVVKNFFTMLKKCRIIPIIIFDGGYEDKKIKTVLSRLKSKLMSLKTTFCRGFSDAKFFPLFMRQVFCEVVTSLKLTQIQCEFEADGEIAALALKLGCPVLSYDSDFFIYDVLYVPFSTVQLPLVESYNGDALQCSVYDIKVFLMEYPGLLKGHLPLIATLLGNDFVESYIFHKFFQQIPLPKRKNMTNLDRRILGLLNWLRHESVASAVEKIESHIGKVNYEKFRLGIEVSEKNYLVSSECVAFTSDDLMTVGVPQYSLNLEKSIVSLLVSCRLPSFLINLIALRSYFLPLQVEDLEAESAHESAIPIIQIIDQLLCSSSDDAGDLILYLRQKRVIKQRTVKSQPSCDSVRLDNLIQASPEIRKKFILLKMEMNDTDVNSVQFFEEECQLFLACFIFWAKFSRPSVFQVHTLLLGYLACQAKHRVGLFRQGNPFSVDDLKLFSSLFTPFRKTTKSAREKYTTSYVHSFSCFQSVLYHCSVLNTLLGSPFTPCKVVDSYSGTLLYNLHAIFFNRQDPRKSVQQLLCPVDSFAMIYEKIYDQLYRYFPATPKSIVVENKRRRRKAKSKPTSTENESISNEEDGDEPSVDYNDLSNKFHLLSAQ